MSEEEIRRGLEIAEKYGLRYYSDWDGIAALWRKGSDTFDIARLTNRDEAQVHKHLTSLRP